MSLRIRVMCSLLVLGLLMTLPGIPTALAEPSDPFSGSTPSFDAAPEEGTDYNSGDWGVSEQNGAATYIFPIDVPPGRNGMAPSLALRYSSNAPLRGGLAAGWTFDIPMIELDRALGVAGGEQYKASLGNVTGRIIGNGVQFDTTNTRFYSIDPDPIEPGPDHWVALTTDGVRHYFEEVASELVNSRRVDTKWRVTRQVDPFGNTVQYEWADVDAPFDSYVIDQSLVRIEYTNNAGAGLVAHAKVEFEYAPLDTCSFSNVPIGAVMRPGSRQVDGAQKLTTIKTFVRDTQDSDWRLSKQIDLTYALRHSIFYELQINPLRSTEDTVTNRNCQQNPLRYLTQIDVTAYAPDGTASSLPPVKFKYNDRIDASRPWLPGENPMREITIDTPGYGQAGASGNSVAGLQTTLLDIDSDGIRDRVSILEQDGACKLQWHKGMLGGSFETQARTAALPTAAWYRDWRGIASSPIDDREGCTLSGQIAYRSLPSLDPQTPGDVWAKGILSYHFMDYTGDGRLDLLTNVWASSCFWTYDPWATPIAGVYCSFNGGPQSIAGATSVPMAPEESGSRFRWRVYPGTGNLDEPFLNNPIFPTRISVASPVPLPPSANDAQLDTDYFTQYDMPPLIDLDGDGFLDIIDTKKTILTDCTNELLLRGCDWTVYFGDGGGTFPETADAYVWNVPTAILALDEWESDNCGVEYVRRRATVADLHDMNGDGLADLVVRLSSGQMQFHRNTGFAFDENAVLMNSVSPLEKTQTDCLEQLQVGILSDGARGYLRRLIDLDGDGLLDMVWFDDGTAVSDITVQHPVYAKFNLGDRFGPMITLLFPEKWILTKRLFSATWNPEPNDLFAGNWHVATDFTDVTGDGLADLVQWQDDSLTYISSPGLPAAPDRLRRVINGQGLEIEFTYTTSTDHNVVDWSAQNSSLPNVRWVVKEVTVDAGFDTPPMHTEYQYGTPTVVPVETARARFAGFQQTVRTTGHSVGSSQQVRNTYRYQVPAAGGYLVKSASYLDGNLQQVNRQEWLHLASAAWPTLHTSCIASQTGMSEADCFAQDDHILRSERTWEIDNGVVVNRQQIEGVGLTPRSGDRYLTIDYYIRRIGSGDVPDDYRVQVLETVYETRDANGSFVRAEHLITDYDSDTGLPDKTRAYFDADTYAETDYEHDVQTGNLLSRQKPMQNADNGGSGMRTTHTYDSHQLFVYETTNELGHLVKTTFDVATGVLVKREGPNRIEPKYHEVVLAPLADTYVSAKEEDQNYGGEQFFYAGYEPGGCSFGLCRRDGIIRFDIAPVLGKMIVGAQLQLSVEETNGSDYPLTLGITPFPDNETWVENEVTFNNYPGFSFFGSFCSSQLVNGADQADWNCDRLVDWVQGWADGGTNEGLLVLNHLVPQDAWVGFATREYPESARRPRLVVTVLEGPSETVHETERWEIDGLGRVLSRSISVDTEIPGGITYTEKTIERAQYNDWNYYNTGQPVSIRSERLREFENDLSWIPSKRTFDGLGRVLTISQLFNGALTTHTTYIYDDIGKIATVEMPDPSNAGAYVTYTYTYDGLGRVTHYGRPDGSGITIAYAGLTETVREDTLDGSGGVKTKTFDVFGRLIQLQEATLDDTPAVTTYRYDANDNVSRITDADGNVTQLSHDWLNNRVAIRREGRVWAYSYDLNGNLISERSPMPTGADASQYTVTNSYDDLDRVISTAYTDIRVSQPPEPPGGYEIYLPLVMQQISATGQSIVGENKPFSPRERATALHTIQYHYDAGISGIGRVDWIELPIGDVEYSYDVRGLVLREQRHFSLTDVANMEVTRYVDRNYNALGRLTSSVWDDGQQWSIGYDERGLVDTVNWFDPSSSAWRTIAGYERNLTGLPLSRNSDYGQTRTFTYDQLARPLRDSVTLDGQTNPLAERIYNYTDSGDLASVTGQTNGVSAAASYSYDRQHRLRTADGPNGYRGRFTYSAAGNVLTADVTWQDSQETRDVTYGYGQTDPQAVDQLVDNETGERYAMFGYDPAGNMTWRRTPDGDTLLHWDGLGQIRRAETPTGLETYYYDHTQQRMLAVNPDSGVRFWFGEREIHYTLDGTETLNYLYLSGDGPTLARVENGSAIEMQYSDILQNLMFSLDEAGNVVASFLYGPFGEVVYERGGENHRRQFNGKENDVTTGLRYYGYRYYDPLALRWNSADPLYRFVPDLGLEEPRRMNLYAFSLNNPLRYYDPDGHNASKANIISKVKRDLNNLTATLKGVKTIERIDNAKLHELDKIEADLKKERMKFTKSPDQSTFLDYAYNQLGQARIDQRRVEYLIERSFNQKLEKLSPEELKRRIEAHRRAAIRTLSRHIVHFSRLNRAAEQRMEELKEHRDELLTDLAAAREDGDEEAVKSIEQELEAAAEEYYQLKRVRKYYMQQIAWARAAFEKLIRRE